MGRTKELLDEYDHQSDPTAEADLMRARAPEAEARLALEREWATRHPAEWAEWLRISPLLAFTYDFGTGESYDFPQFLSEVGPRPSAKHVIERLDKASSYGQGNLTWRKQADPRPVDSPYLTADEAAAYCRHKKKTILNHLGEGNIRKMPGTRPPLFRREELDDWLEGRRKSRRK